MKFFKDLVAENGHKIVRFDQCLDGKKYISAFDYSKKYGGTYDGFKYYNDYFVEVD